VRVPSNATYLWSASSCSGIVWEVAFVCGLDFPMPKVFALLEATGHASDCGVAAAQVVVASSLCCNSSASLGSEKYEHFSTARRKKKKTIKKQQSTGGDINGCGSAIGNSTAIFESVALLQGWALSAANRQQDKYVRIQRNIKQQWQRCWQQCSKRWQQLQQQTKSVATINQRWDSNWNQTLS